MLVVAEHGVSVSSTDFTLTGTPPSICYVSLRPNLALLRWYARNPCSASANHRYALTLHA